ncbi:ExbD/TolR family protein [Crenothrix polyspora]|uniref:Biopolymer transport protein ExbD n=1 Tax=Crenothrix polyspora TaxID=360316 RepID=A0A1R4H8C8_9GAMM|nr:biopolymer transporter ExbD [Crenothrix polyspora]SJM92493.1 Biopolymer transport protein ExbD [Crenothrix polyspora]
MAFKPKSDSDSAISEINVTPLVDVMLVLVIILLVTAPLLTQSVHVTLPKTSETTPNIDDQPLQLGIDAQGAITLNKEPVASLDALTTALTAAFTKNKEIGVHLYADQGVIYKKVAEVMATVQQVGISKIAFVTVEE